MESDLPQCPRCKDGDSVRRISETESEHEFAPQPGYIRRSELFQCTCGWTLVRTKPPQGKK